MTWIRWVVVVAVVLAVIWFGVSLWYHRWLRTLTRRASQDSVVVETRLGPVEYGVRGDGPVVLHFHGGNVGHNGWFFLEHLVVAGYRVLTPDRPGYLGTPISNGTTPEQQADLVAALLDTLDTQRVSVVGLSAGGPAAIQFAARHPHRLDALLLLSAISQRTGLSDDQTNSSLDARDDRAQHARLRQDRDDLRRRDGQALHQDGAPRRHTETSGARHEPMPWCRRCPGSTAS